MNFLKYEQESCSSGIGSVQFDASVEVFSDHVANVETQTGALYHIVKFLESLKNILSHLRRYAAACICNGESQVPRILGLRQVQMYLSIGCVFAGICEIVDEDLLYAPSIRYYRI